MMAIIYLKIFLKLKLTSQRGLNMNIELLRTLTNNAKQAKNLNEINENLFHFAKAEPLLLEAAKEGKFTFDFAYNNCFPHPLDNGTLETLKELYTGLNFCFNNLADKNLTVSWE